MTFRIAAGTFALLFVLLSSLVVQAEDEKVDRILVEKGKRRLFLLDGEDVVRVFWISLGDNPVGHKLQEGDERTPEGTYTIDYRNPDSRFHRSLHISYPNAADRERAEQEGVDPGGMIMIHGIGDALGWLRRFHRLMDWTDGCIAVTDAEMDTIWELVEIGTQIEIVP
jgi:murein L,D-transpeptidase YafK